VSNLATSGGINAHYKFRIIIQLTKEVRTPIIMKRRIVTFFGVCTLSYKLPIIIYPHP
jgi:hypothetical protein